MGLRSLLSTQRLWNPASAHLLLPVPHAASRAPGEVEKGGGPGRSHTSTLKSSSPEPLSLETLGSVLERGRVSAHSLLANEMAPGPALHGLFI